MDKTFSPKESRMNSLSCETFGSFSASPGSSICKGDMNRKTSVSLNQRLTPWNSVKLKQEIGLHKYCEWEFLSRKFSSKSFFFFTNIVLLFTMKTTLWVYIHFILTHDLIFNFSYSAPSHVSFKSTRNLSQRDLCLATQ